jgi:hypothetical protein
MKVSTGLLGGVLLAWATLSPHGLTASDPEVTINGIGKCAKCLLKQETPTCRNVIEVYREESPLVYELTDNEVSRDLAGRLCREPKRVKATGTVKVVAGQLELTATKIDVLDDPPGV